MKASDLRVTSLKTTEQCRKAIDQIENDYRNYYSSLSDWNSGKPCHMKINAINKIKAIENLLYELEDKRS